MVLNNGNLQVVSSQDVLVEPGQTTTVEFGKEP
jgi:flagellar basal body L-ring protein FlgH